MGKYVHVHESTEISAPELLEIANDVHIQQGCKFFANGGGIYIGEGTIFAHDVQIMASNHVYDAPDLESVPYDHRFKNEKVKIGNFVGLEPELPYCLECQLKMVWLLEQEV